MSRRASAVRSQPLLSEAGQNKLLLQYRRAEEAKRADTEKVQGLILRDEQEIQRLQDEHDELLCRAGRWTDAGVDQDFTARVDRIDEMLEAEKGKVASLKDEISKWERALAGQKAGGRSTHCTMNLIKSTRVIENKLDRGRKCFNEMMTMNGELREELKILKEERKPFLNVRSHLEQELHAILKESSNQMTRFNEAFIASVKSQERREMLMNQNVKEVAEYIKEKSNLEREMSDHSYFEDFLDIKAIARDNQNTDQRKVKHKELESRELGLEDFEDAMKKIFAETEESDLDKLVGNFIQMEEQNYTLLKFVNCQHNEAESIRRQISQLCNEREMFVAEEQRQQEQHQALRREVSNKQEAIQQRLAGYQQRVDFIEKLLDQLKEGVESLLQISDDSSFTCDQLASSDGVKDENIIENLRRVENRVNELLTLQSFLRFQENLNQWDADHLGTIAGQLLGINPPAVNLTTAAATPAPTNDPDMSVLLEAKEPVCRDHLLTLANKRIQRKKKTD